MAFSGLLALIDDIATIADDVATLTWAATRKTSGIVTDDMAVTAEQTLGIQRERELPVIGKVAMGSLKNKALILVPGALLLNAVAPVLLTPLLTAGGAFLCFEGVEKILHKFLPHAEGASEGPTPTGDPQAFEDMRVRGAIRTDFILSAEIVAIGLGEVAAAPLQRQVMVLYSLALLMTVGVYGLVAVLVKLDDAGEALAKRGGAAAVLGRAVLRGISWVGAVAMLLVGGQLVLHAIHPLDLALKSAAEGMGGLAGGALGVAATLGVGAVAGAVVLGAVTAFKKLRGR
jgi:predicted DNA repair protein MutK